MYDSVSFCGFICDIGIVFQENLKYRKTLM